MATASPEPRYTRPALRERLKAGILKGSKGGRSGQWSARKAQLLAAAYKKAGGGYVGPKRATQKHLDKWAKESWRTKDGKKAVRGKTTSRYLPDRAWDSLSTSEKKATDTKKRKASRRGKQVVANTKTAKKAGKRARR